MSMTITRVMPKVRKDMFPTLEGKIGNMTTYRKEYVLSYLSEKEPREARRRYDPALKVPDKIDWM